MNTADEMSQYCDRLKTVYTRMPEHVSVLKYILLNEFKLYYY